MNPERSGRTQLAVLWPMTSVSSLNEPVLGSPVEISVRWNTKTSEWLDAQGNEEIRDGIAVVAQDIAIGSLMWLAPDQTQGALEQWYGTGSAGNTAQLFEVKAFNSTPDIKGRHRRRTVNLMRFKGHLP